MCTVFLLVVFAGGFQVGKLFISSVGGESLASGEQLVSLLKRLVRVVDMREPVSKHHVYHKALMYDIDVGGYIVGSFLYERY